MAEPLIRQAAVSTTLIGALLLPLSSASAQDEVSVDREERPADDESPEKEEGDAEEEVEEDELADDSPDALVDPVISRFVKRRVLIDSPRFSLETRGKLQVQYFNADSDDLENEDELFIRRFRPFFFGHFLTNWTWKLELELSAEIQARDIDANQLDIRDLYARYQSVGAHRWRLTLGNQKVPFSRDFMTPSVHLLRMERTFVGDLGAGVPDHALGAQIRGEAMDERLAYWGSVGILGHEPGADRLRLKSLMRGESDLNEGVIAAARVDLSPLGSMTFFDGDPHTPRIKYTLSLAGYRWENDGANNSFTEGGIPVDPKRADLESASGFEISGGLRGRGVTLDWQYNIIHGETVAPDFSGGLYVDGETRVDTTAVEGGYWIPRSVIEIGGSLSRADADGYPEPWDEAALVLNVHWLEKYNAKVQIMHSWIFSRNGIPEFDLQQTRIQLQYAW